MDFTYIFVDFYIIYVILGCLIYQSTNLPIHQFFFL